jgi:dynein heavy chain
MNKIEHSISNGNVVVLQNVEEELEASLEPVLNKHIKSVGGKQSMYLGEKEILYNPHFRFYLTTKLPNPTYKAEISTKVTLVNFAVKQKGLEEQLVSVVIGKMEINLEKTRTELILKKAQNEIKLKELDDDILRQL